MSFIIIPICYIEVDTFDEEEESEVVRLQKKAKKSPPIKYCDVTINTVNICSYIGEDETGHTMITMTDGTIFECTHEREVFDNLIVGADALINLTDISDN